MPELPEVETVRRGLEQTIVGKTVKDVDIRVRKLFPDDPKVIHTVLVDARVLAIERRAKVLLIDLSTDWVLAIHLKMTGQLVVLPPKQGGFVGGHPEKAYQHELPHKHTHVIITFADGTHLYFNDLRKFGWMRLFPRQVANHDEHKTLAQFLETLSLGPEPLSKDFTAAYLQNVIAKRSIPIKQLLLEQKGIAGIGNIYADEALFTAKIHPLTKASSLTTKQMKNLHSAIIQVLELGIKHGGTTTNNYVNAQGTRGDMQHHLMVYGREGESCKICGTPIQRVKIGQRSSHYCPICQKMTNS